MIILTAYALFLLWLGYTEYKKADSVGHFVVSSRNAPWYLVGGSIIASCIGGSATIGTVGLSYEIGFAAIWWLLSAVCGFILLTVFLAKKVSNSKALTMPQMLEYYIGKRARFIASIVIVIAWSAILAAQFSAAARIIASIADIPFHTALLVGAFLIVVYSILGGQASILRSDLIQTIIILSGFLLIVLWFVFFKGAPIQSVKFEFFNEKFGFDTWSYYMVILGGSYVVCPMLFARILSAKNEKHAVGGALFAIAGILLGAFLVVMVGVLSKNFITANTLSDTILTNEIFQLLPAWLGIVLLIVLLSAIISSADSCLITASSVFCNDILHTKSLITYRSFTVVFAAAALTLTFGGKNILGFLFAANDIYVSGIVAPVFIAMVTYNGRRMNEKLAIAAIVAGGGLGFYAAVSDIKYYSMLGVLAALVLSLAAAFVKEKHSATVTEVQ